MDQTSLDNKLISMLLDRLRSSDHSEFNEMIADRYYDGDDITVEIYYSTFGEYPELRIFSDGTCIGWFTYENIRPDLIEFFDINANEVVKDVL